MAGRLLPFSRRPLRFVLSALPLATGLPKRQKRWCSIGTRLWAALGQLSGRGHCRNGFTRAFDPAAAASLARAPNLRRGARTLSGRRVLSHRLAALAKSEAGPAFQRSPLGDLVGFSGHAAKLNHVWLDYGSP